MTNTIYKHWRLRIDKEDIAWLHFDKREARANVLSKDVLLELDALLAVLEKRAPAGLIVLSAKASGFIAGADVSEFTAIDNVAQAESLISLGQSIFNRLESLPFATVARIHGFCLGGGLELALACRYRVALDDPATRLGLPEVKLGIHPGFGGTVRLTRLIGAPSAMELMLSGRTVDARSAKRFGLVDRVVPQRLLDKAAIAQVKAPPRRPQAKLLQRLASHPNVRPFIAAYLSHQVRKLANPAHYPAPYALIRLWRDYGHRPERMMSEECHSVAQLITGETAQNLTRVFFLQERLKAQGRGAPFKEGHIHVIGAGAMGGDIAAWCAYKGFRVTLQDREAKFLAPAMQRAHALFNKRVRDPRRRQATVDRLIPDVQGSAVHKADLVIEAVVEELAVKQTLFEQLEPRLKPDAVLATNTSSIPLERLAEVLSRPQRLVGIHFFNPVAKMQLVEVIRGANTAPEALDRAAAFARAIDRLPLPVKSAPGFLINRLLLPYLLEAMLLLEEGVPRELVDDTARSFGMPMGPLELADAVGLDVCLSVGKVLAEAFAVNVPERLRQLVGQGRLGHKAGRGFYEYKQGKIRRAAAKFVADDVLRDRLILTLINEAVACLHEGVVEDPDLVDAGMVFGTGFAPFRGGPMHYLKTRGKQEVLSRLHTLAERFGARFAPRPGWQELNIAQRERASS